MRDNFLKIAMTVDPEIPVPPTNYGGIERIVDMLVRGLVRRGHDVTLFANPASQVPCRLLPYPALRSRNRIDLVRNMSYVSSNVLRGHYDVIHSFARLAYLTPILPLRIPKVMTYQRAITPNSVTSGRKLAAQGTLRFTAVSAYVSGKFVKDEDWDVIYNFSSLETYRPTDSVPPDAPLVYLGRLEHFKGPHVAVEVARRSGRTLILAGNIPQGEEHQAYYDREIQPFVDGTRIQYVGPVNDAQKNDLMGKAAAVLMPLLGEDAFPIVAPEALACGAPIVTFRRGPMPEAVVDGVSGFVCDSVEEMVAAVARLDSIDRRNCRRIMEEKFSDAANVIAYENSYRKAIRSSNH